MQITSIQQQQKRADRYSVFVDGAYAFSLSESGLIQSRLVRGQEVTAGELSKLRRAAGVDKAYGQALRYVALRPRSQWEVESYLARKAVDAPTAQEVIGRLQALNLLNDVEFARTWVANRRLLKSVSKRRLQQELKLKRIPEAVIQEVLAADQTTEADALRQLIDKKRTRYPDDQKLMQYLARQGFGFDDIKRALRESDE